MNRYLWVFRGGFEELHSNSIIPMLGQVLLLEACALYNQLHQNLPQSEVMLSQQTDQWTASDSCCSVILYIPWYIQQKRKD